MAAVSSTFVPECGLHHRPGVTLEIASAHLVAGTVAHAADPVHRVAEAALRATPSGVDAVFVVDAHHHLVGVVPLAALVGAARDAPIAALAHPRPRCLAPGTDQERVALHAVRHGLAWVPIEGADGRFLGVVPPATLLRILHREHVEDLHRLAGIRREKHVALDALEEAPLRRVRHRLPWLLVGLAGSALAAWVMAGFARALEARVAIAYFIPGVVYLADAIGTQTEAISVRFLSLGHGSLRRVLFAEVRTGLLLGLSLAAVAFPAIAIAFSDLRLAAAVAAAICVASTIAATLGLCFPWALSRLGADPAFGSGPLATIVQDVLSLLVYFAIVRALTG